jgi:hypothetical protein
MSLNISIFLVLVNLYSCNKLEDKQLQLKKINDISNFEIDTLEKCFNDSFYIINIIEKGFKGNIKINCGFIVKSKDSYVIYKVINIQEYRISKNQISAIDKSYYGKSNWGWFNIDSAGRILRLPNEEFILDSLNIIYLKKGLYVNSNSTGEFFVYKDGKIIEEMNYGNFLFRNKIIEFNNLENITYRIENNSLKTISKNSDYNVEKFPPGIYFISKPGLGVKNSYSKLWIFKNLISEINSKNSPEEITIPR